MSDLDEFRTWLVAKDGELVKDKTYERPDDRQRTDHLRERVATALNLLDEYAGKC